ncbi:hypothetical protein Gogos_021484 [Gossypium gossypioides]|uniref:Uncharacterized protein n=1 Tax=Gossypium gossypioides TaxID=34282 RepID=A0A7J9CZZ6_GOSGO|nr:hypothetical protein [Gossypium gossypioides]
MESNSFLKRNRKGYLNPLRNPISKSDEWKGLKIQENPLLKHVSNMNEWRDLVRGDDQFPILKQLDQEIDSELDDDRLLRLNQFDQEIDSELLDLLFKYKLQILLEMVKLFINQ